MSASLQPVQIGVQEMLWTEHLEPLEAKHWKMWTRNTAIVMSRSLQHPDRLGSPRQCERLAKPSHAEQAVGL